MAFRTDLPQQSRKDHTRQIVGNQGQPIRQTGDGRTITIPGGNEEETSLALEGEDVASNAPEFFRWNPESNFGATAVGMTIVSQESEEFDVYFSIQNAEGDPITSYFPPQTQSVTELTGEFVSVPSPFFEVVVRSTSVQENIVNGALFLATGASDIDDENFLGVRSGRQTALVADGTTRVVGDNTRIPEGVDVVVKALSSNTDPLDIGDFDSVSSGGSFELSPGDGVELSAKDIYDLAFEVQTDGDGVCWIVEGAA